WSIDLGKWVGPGYEGGPAQRARGARDLQLGEIRVCPVRQNEEGRFQQLLDAHHYLGAVRKISETLWYAADYRGEWVALLSFSAAAWKCTVRDEWIGWDYRHQYDRLKLIANNSRFLILPQWHRANLGSTVLSRCARRLGADWRERFGHPLGWSRPSSTRHAFTAPSIARRTGSISARAGATAAPAKATALPLRRPRRSSSRPCRPMPGRSCHGRFSSHPIAWEHPGSCCPPTRCEPCRISLPTSPIRAAARAGATRCRQFWPSLPAPSCAACADTRPSPNGPTISPPRRANASAADAAAANTWCPANSPSAICSSASTRPSSTGLCKGGTRLTPRKMKAWPSMARPCATPSTTRAVKPKS